MRKTLTLISFLFLSVALMAQNDGIRYQEKLDSIVSDNGDIARFTYDEQFRTVTKNTFKSDILVRREISEYAEDGSLSAYCAYEERESQFVPVHKKVRVAKDKSVELSDSVYEESLKKLVVNTSEILTYDKNNNLVSLCKKMYDPKSDGKSYNLHEIYYDAEGNITGETIEGPEYKYTKEYKDGRLYVLTKYENRDGLWVILESTVMEYYETGVLKNEYTYDYSGIIFYMKNFAEYNVHGEKIKYQERLQYQEELQNYSYKYTRDEKGRVKEIEESLFDTEKIIGREVFYYDQLPIDSAYYILQYSSDATEPVAKYYYIPNKIVNGKVEGGYSVYEKSSSDGSWIDTMANGNELSYSFGDKAILAHYEVNDETINFTDYTITDFTDYGKIVKKQEKGTLISEEEIYYDKSVSGSLIVGLEEDYKVSYVLRRDKDENEVKNTYYYTSLAETTSIANTYYLSSNTQSSLYNLQGQKILCPQKGINIKNGRKIIFNH